MPVSPPPPPPGAKAKRSNTLHVKALPASSPSSVLVPSPTTPHHSQQLYKVPHPSFAKPHTQPRHPMMTTTLPTPSPSLSYPSMTPPPSFPSHNTSFTSPQQTTAYTPLPLSFGTTTNTTPTSIMNTSAAYGTGGTGISQTLGGLSGVSQGFVGNTAYGTQGFGSNVGGVGNYGGVSQGFVSTAGWEYGTTCKTNQSVFDPASGPMDISQPLPVARAPQTMQHMTDSVRNTMRVSQGNVSKQGCLTSKPTSRTIRMSCYQPSRNSNTSRRSPKKMHCCSYCCKPFTKQSNKRIHERIHTGTYPYICRNGKCQKRFMWRSSINFHEKNCMGRAGLSLERTPYVQGDDRINTKGSRGSPGYRKAHTERRTLPPSVMQKTENGCIGTGRFNEEAIGNPEVVLPAAPDHDQITLEGGFCTQ